MTMTTAYLTPKQTNTPLFKMPVCPSPPGRTDTTEDLDDGPMMELLPSLSFPRSLRFDFDDDVSFNNQEILGFISLSSTPPTNTSRVTATPRKAIPVKRSRTSLSSTSTRPLPKLIRLKPRPSAYRQPIIRPAVSRMTPPTGSSGRGKISHPLTRRSSSEHLQRAYLASSEKKPKTCLLTRRPSFSRAA